MKRRFAIVVLSTLSLLLAFTSMVIAQSDGPPPVDPSAAETESANGPAIPVFESPPLAGQSIPNNDCSPTTWQLVSPVNTARSRPGLAYSPFNGKFYLAGGVADGDDQNIPIEEYDPVADTWTDRAYLLTGVSNTGAVAVGQYIYIPGGYDGFDAIADMQRYDIQSDTVITMTAMPDSNFAHTVVALGGKIYVLGGAPDGFAGTTNYIYDIAGNSWSSGAALPTAVSYPGGATDGTYIYVLGGRDAMPSPNDLAIVQRYDPAMDTWDNLPDMNSERGGPGAFFSGSNLWVVGGGWNSRLTSTEYWDGSAWQDGPTMNVGVRTMGAAFGDGSAIKAAGWSSTGYESAAERIDLCPEISVSPSSLLSIQKPDTQVTETLSISNTGLAELNWTIEEAPGGPPTVCNTPSDLPWVSVDPLSGITEVGGSSPVHVTFDSTGLTTDVYTGTLCIESNDPNNPQLTLPLTMTVNTPAVYLPMMIRNGEPS